MSNESTQNVVVSPTNTIVDLDLDPLCPIVWKVESHKKGGLLDVTKAKIGLYLSPNQQGSGRIEGNKLREELGDKPVLNANLLDWYLANPSLIPEDWRRRVVFFWGTIYRDSDGLLFVRDLYWNGNQWRWDVSWLGSDWFSCNPVAILEP